VTQLALTATILSKTAMKKQERYQNLTRYQEKPAVLIMTQHPAVVRKKTVQLCISCKQSRKTPLRDHLLSMMVF